MCVRFLSLPYIFKPIQFHAKISIPYWLVCENMRKLNVKTILFGGKFSSLILSFVDRQQSRQENTWKLKMSPRQTLTLSLDTRQRTMESGKRQVKLLGVKKNYMACLTLCLGHWMTVSDLTKPSFAYIQKAT